MQDRSKPWINDRLLLSEDVKPKRQNKSNPGPKQLQRLLSIPKRQVTEASRMKALVILPLLLCAVVCTVQVRAEVKAVKLCGREFLRAVVYTCGGSRWRRLLTESDVDALPTGEQSSLETLSSSSSSSAAALTRRDMNNILTTVCCQMGCRKSDLTFLC
ncbi:insulin-like 5a [Hippoglossus hippoglossus]|uniref:insulin-like 5a n=1 Tax=Hippoglossus hippoglossus TaxID=8267 RepID=UPI00148E0E94|nr:insulin-like 5a [Hippoglossus hippoglossus]